MAVFLLLNNETKEVGRLTYTIFPEDHKFIISFVLVHPEFEGRGMGKFFSGRSHQICQRK